LIKVVGGLDLKSCPRFTFNSFAPTFPPLLDPVPDREARANEAKKEAGEGRRLDFGEAFSVAVRRAVIKYNLGPGHARRVIAHANATLQRQCA
jgi:hypothetical protein